MPLSTEDRFGPPVRIYLLLFFAAPAVLIGGSTPSSIALSSSPGPSVFGQPVTLTAVVVPPTATGNVAFYDGTTVLGTAALTAGQATFSTIFLPSGNRSLQGYYSGDANYAPSLSSKVAQTVNAVPGGGFQAAVNYSAGVGPASIALGDFNGDGRADLAVVNAEGVSVLLGNGDGTFKAPMNYGAGVTPTSIAVGDFNRDGKADIAVCDINVGNISVLLGNGDGTFQTALNYGIGGYPISIAVGDFNGDGKPDLAVGDQNDGVIVLLGNGDGTFQAAATYGIGSSAGQMAVGDFNGDGRADLAVSDEFTLGSMSVLLGNGDGTFQAAANYGTGTGPGSIVVADFNGDGKADLATGNLYNVSVLLGNGNGTFQTAVYYGTGPASIAIGDFNGDGKPDIAVVNTGSSSVTVLLGRGDGTFLAAAGSYSVGSESTSMAVGDFNGNGRADLVTANYKGNDVSVLLALAPFPELSVVIAHSGNFAQGQSGATYTITISNVGSAPTLGVVTVADSLSAGLIATGISGVGWTCVLATLTCTRGDPLAAVASYPAITLAVNVAANAPGGVTDTVMVSGGGVADTASETASDFITTFTQSQVAQTWSSLNPPASLNGAGAALLMTDGTIMVQQGCSSSWYRLAPDSFGNYASGTWSQAASMPPGYGPGDFSSAVLADGRLVVIGGEYNNPCTQQAETNLGAIYDPRANAWTPLSAPGEWTNVGDASNVVLPNGQFLLASIVGDPTQEFTQLASLDPVTLNWTIHKGTGKADSNSEEGWTLLPDGTILTVDIQNGTQAERYLPQSDTWVSAGNTVVPLVSGDDIGPQVLRPDGTVFAIGATGHTAVYNIATGVWSAGPDFPISNGQQLLTEDGPGALLPSGNVLVTVNDSQSNFFFEFDGTHLNPVPASGGCFSLLLLPTGQVLCSNGRVSIYTPTGGPNSAWAPTIIAAPSVVQPGLTYGITGTQFNGLSQAVGFGDDYQGATNYPLVRITNAATGHVFYCRTHNHSTMGVATGSATVSTQFDVPPSIETGPSTLVVVANGIPSKPWNLTIATTQSASQPTIQSVEGSGLSVPAVKALSANGFFTIFGANLAPVGTSRQLTSSDIVNGSLPTSLASTCVIAGSVPAFLTYVSPTQINGIAPALPITGSAAVSVVANCGAPNQVTSSAVNVPVAAASPEFLYWVQNANGQDPVVAVDAGDYIGPPGLIPGLTFRPAIAGDILTIYGIGFGQTEVGPVPGVIPSMADSVPAGYSVTIGGTTASASYVGVTPTIAGLYQVNVTIPSGIAPGNYSIVLSVNGASTPAGGYLAIGP